MLCYITPFSISPVERKEVLNKQLMVLLQSFTQTNAGYCTHNPRREFIACYTFLHLSCAANGIMTRGGISFASNTCAH